MTNPKFLQIVENPSYGMSLMLKLTNGVWIKYLGDERALGDDGLTYVLCTQGVGEPRPEGGYEEYEDLGWLEINDAINAGLWDNDRS